MRPWRLFLVLGAVSALHVISSCSGDDDKKKTLPAPDAAAGAGGDNSGGSSAGKGGTAAAGGTAGAEGGAAGEAQGGAAGDAGMGGTAGDAGMGGEATGGEGGAGSCETPITVGLTCTTILDSMTPSFDPATGVFTFDVSSLGTIVDGAATYFEYTLDIDDELVVGCTLLGSTNFESQGSTVTLSIGNVPTGTRVALTTLWLEDECGNEYEFIGSGGAACWDLSFTAGGGDSWPMSCTGAGTCAAQCN